MILDALDGNGLDQLARLALSILTKPDPDPGQEKVKVEELR